ncbi:alpha/beta fold hydrolase [bacterium]|nr:alpha/beta fold hydrolase [bacterium]
MRFLPNRCSTWSRCPLLVTHMSPAAISDGALACRWCCGRWMTRLRLNSSRSLAADLTSPLLDILDGMPKRSNVQGFLQPFRRSSSLPRLEMLEPYVPGKIPVVFIHGLASDEGTWFEMLNELRTWPAFHRCFTPWVFHYPTGAPFLPTSAQLRLQLAQLIEKLDPTGTTTALQQVVLVGHSMGGLHAKMMVVSSGDRFWSAISYKPFAQVKLPGTLQQRMRESFFFEPVPQVRRVVFIATPHGGSSWATRAVGQLASAAVQQPEQIRAVHEAIISSNPHGTFHPDFERRLPTTIDTRIWSLSEQGWPADGHQWLACEGDPDQPAAGRIAAGRCHSVAPAESFFAE